MKPKITHKEAAVALLSLAFLLAYANGTQARAGPKITPTQSPTATETATVTPSPSNTPSPVPTLEPTAKPSATQTPTPTMNAEQRLYATRGWATITPTRTEWPKILPCSPQYVLTIPGALDYLDTLVSWTLHWRDWIEMYREQGTHEVPLPIGLAVIMQESRGNPRALSCRGAIGLFQILASDAVLELPSSCGGAYHVTVEGNPTTAELLQSSKNIRFGLDRIEEYTWEARAYVQGWSRIPYRENRFEILPQARELDWWYTWEGRVTLGMYLCGPTGFRNNPKCKPGDHENPGKGWEYAEEVLGCWVPWVTMVDSWQSEPIEEIEHKE